MAAYAAAGRGSCQPEALSQGRDGQAVLQEFCAGIRKHPSPGKRLAGPSAEYCKKGDVIGVKGRMQTDLYDKEGQTHKSTRLVAEKITFLSSKSQEYEKNSTNKKSKSDSKEK